MLANISSKLVQLSQCHSLEGIHIYPLKGLLEQRFDAGTDVFDQQMPHYLHVVVSLVAVDPCQALIDDRFYQFDLPINLLVLLDRLLVLLDYRVLQLQILVGHVPHYCIEFLLQALSHGLHGLCQFVDVLLGYALVSLHPIHTPSQFSMHRKIVPLDVY